MILDNFYTPISSSSNEHTYTFEVKLNALHEIYKGHFPNHPILPGVCTIQMVRELIEKELGKRLQYKQISSCKFLAIVNPIETPDIVLDAILTFRDNNYFMTLVGCTMQDERVFIKMKALFSVVHD